MADYINQDDTLDVLDRVCKACDNDNCYRHKGLKYCPVMTVIDGIKDLPIADVYPIRRGRWVHDRHTQWKCSICGNFLDFDGLNCGRGSAFFCPNCGALMTELNLD